VGEFLNPFPSLKEEVNMRGWIIFFFEGGKIDGREMRERKLNSSEIFKSVADIFI